MNAILQRLWLILLGSVSATALVAASAPKEEVAEPLAPKVEKKEEILAPRTGVQTLFDLDLRRWPEERFYENLSAQIDALSHSHGVEGRVVMMDIAEIYLGQMMLYEAGSVLEGINGAGASREMRLRALRDAHRLLDGYPVDDFETSPLAAPNRVDRAFWAVLQAISSGDPVMLAENLEPGLLGLMHQTRPVAHKMLPILTEAMIEVGAHVHAEQALRLLEDFPDLSEAPVGSFLRGRAHQFINNESSALAAYFEAAKGFDRYAARARLALAKMALDDGGRGAILAARDVLEHGKNSWKGDFLEVQNLQTLAEVYVKNQDDIAALTAYGTIMLRFPGTAASDQAEEKASARLQAVYAAGEAGDIPLSHWLSVHYQLVPAFRYYAAFPKYVERVGDHLYKTGGTSMAADEYQRGLDLLRDLRIHHPERADDDLEFQLHLKKAEALAAGGQYREAKELLASLEMPDAADQREVVNRLRASVYAKIGDAEGLLRTHVKTPTPSNLRHVAQALWAKGNWAEAITFYERLWQEFPGQFDADDATYLLIAAHRADRDDVTDRVISFFPKLTESEGWMEIAQSFRTDPPPVFPLSRYAADNRIDRLQKSLENLSKSGL
ncbi:tetratricopeptide repeat protein [Cognatishimia maritima]|uniref:Tetratricopeptide repeat-containing protein n=1 Tax=Cognatishimia maritima TaxID=870908 RepID=A0A1M5VT51_9RHOB|nr:tetratricopeptide repeat protein [Cognatishimia maritima]SHH78368.1 Tetratricopeptide repeat-containing protein [Cognatishimia maritima]